MEIYQVFLIMRGLPLLAVLVSFGWVLLARRSRDLELDEWQGGTFDRRAEFSRLVLLLGYTVAKVMYGLVQAFFLVFSVGGFSGAPLPASVAGLSLPVFCALCATVNCITALADAFLGARAVRDGSLVTMEGFRSAFIKLSMVEFLAILGLLISALAILGYLPL